MAAERWPRMHGLVRSFAAAALLAPALSLAACGPGDAESDPAAIDAHLNQAIAREEADRRQLVEKARAREAVRDGQMEQNAANYAAAPD